ncbi:hypothetical protein ANCCAN_24542 [Ancylostoma caninum]|uniref:Uncharacterized protein n=1 Tax=Ancylostoma caninum TaxID=29170 RepID=A0A368FFA4_ANCCA|nr:hypothetical protein ANCCAN_24542 [Ancylostoma caninum]
MTYSNALFSCSQQPPSEVPRVPPHAPSSPKSMRSDSTLSVDSGQCSGDVALTSQHSFSSSREEREDKEPLEETSSIFHVYQQRCLPGYARIASERFYQTQEHCFLCFCSPPLKSNAGLGFRWVNTFEGGGS